MIERILNMNIRKFIFLFVTPALDNDENKYSLKKIIDKGYQVEIWDLTPAIVPETEKAITAKRFASKFIYSMRYDNIRQIEENIQANCESAFFFPMFDLYFEVRKLYDMFTKYNVRYGYVNNMVCDFDAIVDNVKIRIGDRLRIQYVKALFFNRIWKKFLCYKPAEFIGFGTIGNENTFMNRDVCSDKTEKLYLHTFDYERFMDVMPYEHEHEYCVFLDQYIPFHPDNIVDAGLKIDAQKYYNELNAILDSIRRVLKMDIIVAAHPRADYSDKMGYVNGYRVEYGKTPELIKGASLVVAHSSTAIGMVPMAKVPLAIIDIDSVSKVKEFDVICKLYAEKLGVSLIHTPQDIKKNVLDYDLQKYNKFEREYMTCNMNENESLWSKVVEYLESKP